MLTWGNNMQDFVKEGSEGCGFGKGSPRDSPWSFL